MSNPKMTRLLLGVVMLMAAGLAVLMKPVAIAPDKRPNLEVIVPKQFADWHLSPHTDQVLPNPDQQKTLNEIYDQILTRTYVNGQGKMMMLTITYGSKQTNQLKAHRQEVCYRAQGFTIHNLKTKIVSVAQRSIPMTQMLAEKGPRLEPVTYWFTMGGRVVLSRFERLMIQIKYGLNGEIPDGVLVRISNIGEEEQQSYATHIKFLEELLQSMTSEGVTQLIGQSI